MYTLSFRLKNTGGPVMSGSITPDNGTLLLARHVVFLLHGYNVKGDRGQSKLSRFAKVLDQRPGEALVAVLWPGDSWAGALSYSFEGNDADDTGRNLATWIRTSGNIASTTRISFVSHSLGARVVMQTIKHLAEQRRNVEQVCLMAAAIDDFSLSHPKLYFHCLPALKRVNVLWSRADKTLRRYYPAGDLLQNFIYHDEVTGEALGLWGPKPYKSSKIPEVIEAIESKGADHGSYLPNHDQSQPVTPHQQAAAAYARACLDS